MCWGYTKHHWTAYFQRAKAVNFTLCEHISIKKSFKEGVGLSRAFETRKAHTHAGPPAVPLPALTDQVPEAEGQGETRGQRHGLRGN